MVLSFLRYKTEEKTNSNSKCHIRPDSCAFTYVTAVPNYTYWSINQQSLQLGFQVHSNVLAHYCVSNHYQTSELHCLGSYAFLH